MAYYKDLREYLERLEAHGKLVRVKSQINKDTQLHPLARLQFRGLPEEMRKAFLFENVIDSRGRRYDTPVAVCALAASSEVYAIGMMCRPEEITEKLAQAELHPIPPDTLTRGPVQEEVHVGERLLEHGGLDEFPVPISTPGYDIAPFFTAPCWVTKDPETGIRNVGTYRAQLKSPSRTGVYFGIPTQGGLIHWQKCRARGIPLEAAIVIGGPPNIGYVSVSRLPLDVDEFTVAGGIAGEPVKLVRCRTVDLEVPACAEIVIEGEINTEEMEPEAPFGEAMGFVGLEDMMPYFTVKCITHRKQPIWLSFLSQYPPSESSKIRGYANGGTLLKHLRHDLGMTHVVSVAFHDEVGSTRMVVIKMKKVESDEVWRTLEAAGKRFRRAKIIVAVDEDIEPSDCEAVNVALCHRMQPHRDCRVVKAPADDVMDPSVEPVERMLEKRDAAYGDMPESSRLFINATMKWPYPPLSLPKKEFMDEALKIWRREGLPDLKLKQPWWGHNLGYWTQKDDERAALAVEGEYYQTGQIQARARVKAGTEGT